MTARILAEWHPLRRVVVRPPGMEAFFGLLEPYSNLYERVFSLSRARKEHEELSETLRSGFGVRVQNLDQMLLEAAGRRPQVAQTLFDEVVRTVVFSGPGSDRARREFRSTIRSLDGEQLIQTLVLSPSIRFERGRGARSVSSFMTLRVPLTNLFFLRDQQAVTDRGSIVGRLAKPQRRRETEITSFVWRASGERPVTQIQRGTFEGGDYLPARDFALIGTGDRTSRTGVEEFLENGVGVPEVGVVHQPRHPLVPTLDPMVNMHLDTYLNFPGEGIAVGHREMLEAARVEVYVRDSGRYHRSHETKLLKYLETTHGFRVDRHLNARTALLRDQLPHDPGSNDPRPGCGPERRAGPREPPTGGGAPSRALPPALPPGRPGVRGAAGGRGVLPVQSRGPRGRADQCPGRPREPDGRVRGRPLPDRGARARIGRSDR